MSISKSGPIQESPPCFAGCSTERCRVCQPVTQRVLHVDQLDHGASMQFCGIFGQPMVCTNSPVQGIPPFIGILTTSRFLSICNLNVPPKVRSHPSQSDQSLTSQSCVFWQVAGQTFVSSIGPSQPVPQSLLCLLMIRWRSQSPKQVGSCQSLQSEKVQSSGMHGSHSSMSGHSVTFSCVPAHADWSTARKRDPDA